MLILFEFHCSPTTVTQNRLVDDFEREIRFDVTVIEDLTERKQNTSSLLTLYKYKYKMELIKTSDSFKPGLKYTAFVSY